MLEKESGVLWLNTRRKRLNENDLQTEVSKNLSPCWAPFTSCASRLEVMDSSTQTGRRTATFKSDSCPFFL